MQALADYCGTTVEDIANQVMEKSYGKIEPVILELAAKYKLEKDQISLVGVGGGASVLIVYFARKMGLKYSIPKNAEVISSIGVALAMVRDVVERIIPSPSKDDIRSIKAEAMNKAIESGASPDSVEIHIEIDSQTSKVTAIATGSTEVKTTDLLQKCSEQEARCLAAADMGVSPDDIGLLQKTEYFFVFGGAPERPGGPGPVRIVDSKGFIKVQRGCAMVTKVKAKDYRQEVERLWEEMAVYQSEMIARPDYYLCMGPRVMDFSATEFSQLSLLMEIETSAMDPEDDIIVTAANMKQT